MLTFLLALHIIFANYRLRTPELHTKLAVASAILDIVVSAATIPVSLLEDQRSIKPSDVLILYFTALTILGIPRLRSLWMISPGNFCRIFFTAIYVLTVVALFLEMTHKSRFLRPPYQHATPEQKSDIWSRNFFIWIMPLFRSGYSSVLSLKDIPELADDLQGDVTSELLEKAWIITEGRQPLLRALLFAYRWPLVSAILPRFALSGFKFCQPFLITCTLKYFSEAKESSNHDYGRALIVAYLVVYLGLAVSQA